MHYVSYNREQILNRQNIDFAGKIIGTGNRKEKAKPEQNAGIIGAN